MRFLIVVLCLLVAGLAAAVPVDPDAPDGVAARYVDTNGLWVLCTDGRVFSIDYVDRIWTEITQDPVPEPVLELLDWTPYLVVTQNGFTWKANPTTDIDRWPQLPELSCTGPQPNQSESLGNVKALYRKFKTER